MASPESHALRKCTAELNTALANIVSVEWFADRLLAEDFIAQEVYDNVQTFGVSNYSKVIKLMSSVRAQVANTPSMFSSYVAILKEKPALSNVVGKLLQVYSDLKLNASSQSHTTTHPNSSSSSSSSSSSVSTQHSSQNGAASIGNGHVRPSIVLEERDLVVLLDLLNDVSFRWISMGDRLGFMSGELSNIQHNPTLIPGGPSAFLRQLLSQWLKRAPPKHPWPTIEALASVLRAVGEERLANDLRDEFIRAKKAQ